MTRGLMTNNESPRLFDTFDNGLQIKGKNSLQINQLNFNFQLFFHFFQGLQTYPKLRPIGNNSQVLPRPNNFTLSQLYLIRVQRDLLFQFSVQSLRLKKDDWIGVQNRSRQKSLGSNTVSWLDQYQSRGMGKKCLIGLAMPKPPVTNRATGSPYSKASAVPVGAASISELGCLVDQLVEGRENVVVELDLSYGIVTLGGKTYSESGDSLLAQRGVEDSVVSVFFVKVLSAAENTSKLNVFPKDVGVLVLGHELIQGFVYGLEEVQFLGFQVGEVLG